MSQRRGQMIECAGVVCDQLWNETYFSPQVNVSGKNKKSVQSWFHIIYLNSMQWVADYNLNMKCNLYCNIFVNTITNLSLSIT